MMIRAGVITFGLLAAVAACADEPADVKDELSEKFLSAAKAYEMTAGEGAPLNLVPRPILNWTNPERKTKAGSVFIWTDHDGRPAVAMCIYPSGGGAFDHEFQSLSTSAIQAKLGVSYVWWPREAGINYAAVEDAKVPGKTQAVRLTQMRAFARKFSARIVGNNSRFKPLRLLTSPVYRYPESKSEGKVTDGAIFVFVQGTDPEVLLLIEAVRDDEGTMQWRYALARMSMVRLEVSRNEKVVWTTEWANGKPDGIYFTIHNEPGGPSEAVKGN